MVTKGAMLTLGKGLDILYSHLDIEKQKSKFFKIK